MEGRPMTGKSAFARVTRRTFNAALGGAFVAGITPFNIVRAQGAALKVGVLLPRSGFEAGIGQDCQRGVDITAGVLKDLGLPPLQIVNADTESSVDTARSQAEKLIGNGAQLLMGAFDSGQTTAIAQVAEQKGVPFIINIAAAPPITEQGYKFVFRNFPTAPMILRDAFIDQKEVFAAVGSAPKTVVFMHVNDTILLTRELIKQRWTPMAVLSMGPGWYEDQYLKTLGKLADGPMSFAPWYDPNKPMSKKLEAALAKAHPGVNLNTNHVYTFEALLIAADAYKRAGSADPKALADAIRTTNITDNVSIGPGIQFDAKGQNDKIIGGGLQNRGGKVVTVAPKAAAIAKAEWPLTPYDKRG